MATGKDRSAIRFPRSIWLLGVLWLGLGAGAALWGVPHQEDHLTGRAQRALSGSPLSVIVEGRDAILSGDVETNVELSRARTAVLTQTGIRRVDTENVTVLSPSGLQPAVATVVLVIADGVASLSGVLPDPASEDAIVSVAESRFSTLASRDFDTEPGSDRPSWLPTIVEALRTFPPLDDATLTFEGDRVTVEGIVASPPDRDEALLALSAALGPDVLVEDRLAVAELIDPTLVASLADGSVSLSGVMPDDATVATLEGSAALSFGAANVSSELTTGQVAAPEYLAELPGLFSALSGLSSWEAVLEAGRLSVAGTGASEAGLDAATTDLANLWQGAIDLELALQVDAADLAATLTGLLEGSTNFEVGSATLSAEARTLLDDAIEILLANPSTSLVVEGHTDDVGSESDNLALSEARAQAVVDYLVDGGIDGDRLAAVGFGETQPIDTNDTDDGRAANRRIEFVVTEGDE